MNVTQAFIDTRKPTEDVQLVALWEDLNKQANINSDRHIAGKRVKAHKFHIINTAGFYVNVILSATNNVSIRGLICNNFDAFKSRIENIND